MFAYPGEKQICLHWNTKTKRGLMPALPNLYRNGGHSEVSFHEVCYSGEDVIFPRQVTR